MSAVWCGVPVNVRNLTLAAGSRRWGQRKSATFGLGWREDEWQARKLPP